MHTPPRYPIEVVRHLAPPAPVRLGGRVVALSDDAALVQDVTDRLWVACSPLPPIGAWVIGEGEWNGERIHGGRCQLVNVPRVPFPDAGGDWSWLEDRDGHRVKLLRQRARISRAAREFFDQRAFTEVETPIMVPSPGLDVHLDAFAVGGQSPPRWLITSPEYQMKRLLAGGMPRIYQLARCFRRDEEGSLHQPEFTMLEWYRAFGGSAEVMRDTEELVAHVASMIHSGSTVIPGRASPVDVAAPWERMTVAQAFQKYAGVAVQAVLPDEERFFRILVEQVEPQLGALRPVFLTQWPSCMASLARLDPRDPTLADRFEGYIGGVEICNGFGELIDPVEQRDRLERDQKARAELGKTVYPIDPRFMRALEEGLPPSGGNALGFDRLVMMVLGVEDIEDVVAFSRSRL